MHNGTWPIDSSVRKKILPEKIRTVDPFTNLISNTWRYFLRFWIFEKEFRFWSDFQTTFSTYTKSRLLNFLHVGKRSKTAVEI